MRPLNQIEKYLGYKSAIDEYNELIRNNNILSAYILALSILEDSIISLFVSVRYLKNEINYDEWINRNKKWKTKGKGIISVGKMVDILSDYNYVNENLEDKKNILFLKIRKHLDDRNENIHNAMWNYKSIKKKDCREIIKSFNALKKFIYQINKLTPQKK